VRNSLLKRCFTVVAAAGLMAVAFGPSAQAATTGTSPHWYNGHIDQFRAGGSETTFYVMNAINNLYSQSSLFGCTLLTSDFQTCNTAGDTQDTDTLDNYDRDEFDNGAGIGSGNGLSILCGVPAGAIPEDFARSSRPSNGSSCENSLTFLPFAKDALVGVVFDKEHAVTTGSATTPIGPVAAGWRGDGDATNCNLLSNPGPHFDNGVNGCDGVPFNNISNVGGASSVAFKIWCDTSASGVSDWGQLTDPTHAVGAGTAIGVPIKFWGVNSGSGTYSVWKSFLGCDPNTKQPDANHLLQENNAPQIRSVENRLFPSDPIQVENDVEASLYWGSFGVMNSNSFSKGGGSFTKINGTTVSPATETASLASFRNVFNAFKPASLKSSVAGFLNWICSTSDGDHGVDLTSGKNYNVELTNTIGTKFGFPRLPCAISTPTDLAH
jgi:ABC-type phosphate transport system substrate-binding protein